MQRNPSNNNENENIQNNIQNNLHINQENVDTIFSPFPQNPFLFRSQDIFQHDHQDRPTDIHHNDEEPLYVNAKQYFRILKRRVARTRLEELHRLSRQRKVGGSCRYCSSY